MRRTHCKASERSGIWTFSASSGRLQTFSKALIWFSVAAILIFSERGSPLIEDSFVALRMQRDRRPAVGPCLSLKCSAQALYLQDSTSFMRAPPAKRVNKKNVDPANEHVLEVKLFVRLAQIATFLYTMQSWRVYHLMLSTAQSEALIRNWRLPYCFWDILVPGSANEGHMTDLP